MTTAIKDHLLNNRTAYAFTAIVGIYVGAVLAPAIYREFNPNELPEMRIPRS